MASCGHRVQPPVQSRVTYKIRQGLPAALSTRVLKVSKDRDCTVCLATSWLPSKGKCFFMASLTLTFQFMPILSQPPTPCAAVKNLALFSSKTHRYKAAAIRSFQNLLFSRLNTASSISLSSKDTWTQPPWSSFAELAPVSWCLSCTGPKLAALF